MFQSPQWGSNSKDSILGHATEVTMMFQSPQWGSNSKDKKTNRKLAKTSFSPRNGEVILK